MRQIEIFRKDELARYGVIKTLHGEVETPVFMPVGTHGTVKAITHRDLKEIGVRMILANAYHLYLRPGDRLIKEMGGIHRFSRWDGPMLTDSGGYQVFSLGLLREIREEGVAFQSHIDGSRHFLTPEKVIEIQRNIGADIWMCLDECVPYPASYEYTSESVGLTTRWARRCKDAKIDEEYRLFGIVQGGFYKDLRIRSALELREMKFDGYAIGGLSVGEPKGLMLEMLDAVLEHLPEDRPRYLMGMGFPEDIIEGVRMGIDMFDCVIPTRLARNGNLFTWFGRINIKNAKYTKDNRPVDEDCNCYVCRTYSRAYLRHLLVSHELTSFYLNTIHNIYFYTIFMKRIRDAINEGRFEGFYRNFINQWKGGEEDEYSACNG